MNDGNGISKPRSIVGGFFFVTGIIAVLGKAFNANGANLEAGLFNLAIGIPLFWPTLKLWLNKIGK